MTPEPIRPRLFRYRAQDAYPFGDRHFDLVISLTTLHNLRIFELKTALAEIERVGKEEIHRRGELPQRTGNVQPRIWATDGQAFFDTAGWDLGFIKHFGYTGDYEFIYFE